MRSTHSHAIVDKQPPSARWWFSNFTLESQAQYRSDVNCNLTSTFSGCLVRSVAKLSSPHPKSRSGRKLCITILSPQFFLGKFSFYLFVFSFLFRCQNMLLWIFSNVERELFVDSFPRERKFIDLNCDFIWLLRGRERFVRCQNVNNILNAIMTQSTNWPALCCWKRS